MRRAGVAFDVGKGNCYDNAMVETFFKTLKSELVWRTVFHTRAQAKSPLRDILTVSTIPSGATRRSTPSALSCPKTGRHGRQSPPLERGKSTIAQRPNQSPRLTPGRGWCGNGMARPIMSMSSRWLVWNGRQAPVALGHRPGDHWRPWSGPRVFGYEQESRGRDLYPKSTEEGLDQEFNSLDAQREACAAYVMSQQARDGRDQEAYDDGGISGGTMDRPALQDLLQDIKAGKSMWSSSTRSIG